MNKKAIGSFTHTIPRFNVSTITTVVHERFPGAFHEIHHFTMFDSETTYILSIGTGHMVFWTIIKQNPDSPAEVLKVNKYQKGDDTSIIDDLFDAFPPGARESEDLIHYIEEMFHL